MLAMTVIENGRPVTHNLESLLAWWAARPPACGERSLPAIEALGVPEVHVCMGKQELFCVSAGTKSRRRRPLNAAECSAG
jgi:hypothetical protein